MQVKGVLLHEAITNAETRAIQVYNHAKEESGAERSGIYALGHYGGLKEALKLFATQGDDPSRAATGEQPVPAVPSPATYPSFAAIFQKLRPKHGPKALGSW